MPGQVVEEVVGIFWLGASAADLLRERAPSPTMTTFHYMRFTAGGNVRA